MMKQIKLIFPIFFILIFTYTSNGQTTDSIIFVPDRPGMATPPDILSFERIQIENGNTFENNIDGTVHHENYFMPAFLFRIGLLKNAEARIFMDYATKIETDSGITTKLNGLDPITFGTKIKLFKPRKILPKTSVLINLTLPFYGKTEFTPEYLAPSVFLLMSNSILKKLTLCYNYGMIWHGDLSPMTHFYAVSLGTSIFKKISIFTEVYGSTSKYERAGHYYDGGLAFLINNHIQIDVSAAGKFNSNNDYYFVNAGFAWQIASKKMKF